MKQAVFPIVTTCWLFVMLNGCSLDDSQQFRPSNTLRDPNLTYLNYTPSSSDIVIDRSEYADKLHGFWLGQSIANWTGLVTEMDKVGNIGEFKTGTFYTRNDWGKPDQPSIWGKGVPSKLSPTIDFVFKNKGEIWGSDDDTDIEYIYQEMLHKHQTSLLTGEQIKEGWLTHIYTDETTPFKDEDGKPENYLWVSNQAALDAMLEGIVPPDTSAPQNNAHWEMIDAQLTTEIFGLFAPARPDIALKMSYLPIRTTARENAAWASEFYVLMHSLAAYVDPQLPAKEQLEWMADHARQRLPDESYSAKMYDFVKSEYNSGRKWEAVRDDLYEKYQVNQEDGYGITSQNLYCNGCFASGINFAASLVSLFYGEGNIIETIKIGTLAGWDSDNPSATWGGLLGFMLGKKGVEAAFDKSFANTFNIHRTRGGFANNGLDSFENMAKKGIFIVDRVVQEQAKGGVDLINDVWYIPKTDVKILPDSKFKL